MKVDLNANINMYRAAAAKVAAAKSDSAKGKTDVAEFSRGSTTMVGKSLVGVKSTIQRDLTSSTDTARLAEIRQKVKNGSYRIPTNQIVKSLLEA